MKAVMLLVVVLVLGLANSWAQIPRTLSYQGVLTDSTGDPKPDGTYTFTFRLYDAATEGKLIGTQQQMLQVNRGLFHTAFDQLLVGVNMDRPYWLSVQPEGETELAPRIALTAVAYSLSSIRADTARYAVSAPSQPFVDSARVAGLIPDNIVTTAKLVDGAITMSKLNQAGATTGQVISWNGSAWAPGATASGWSLTGNAGMTAGTNFIGTTDSNAFDIRTNNTVKVRITAKGGIETYNTGGSVYLGEYAGTNDDLEAHFLGNGNVFVGFGAGYSNTSGQWNTVSGHSAFNRSKTGAYNTANGHMALFASTSGSYNTAVGEGALQSTSVSSSNTALGAYAGGSHDNGNSNVFLGTNTGAGGDGYSEAIAIGSGTVATGSNVARFGNSATTSYGGWADWSNVSDGRFKSNVQTDVPGLAFITRLRPITYNLAATSLDAFIHKNVKKDALLSNNSKADAEHMNALQEKETIRYSGFVAQEVEATARELGYEFSGVDAPRSESDYYGIRYAQFVVPLVKAVQEQQKMIEAQQKMVEAQQQMVENQQRQIEELNAMVKSLSGAK